MERQIVLRRRRFEAVRQFFLPGNRAVLQNGLRRDLLIRVFRDL